MVSRRLRLVTGWALLVGAAGIFIDSWAATLNRDSPEWLVSIVAPAGVGEGSIGLILAYLGVIVGMVGLVLVLYRIQGLWAALLCGVGVLSMFVFWGSYPARATFGGVGGIIIGIALLSLPSWGRLASPVWVASGVMGTPELVGRGSGWGPIVSFNLIGAAIAITGAFILYGMRIDVQTTRSRYTSLKPTP